MFLFLPVCHINTLARCFFFVSNFLQLRSALTKMEIALLLFEPREAGVQFTEREEVQLLRVDYDVYKIR